MGNVAQKSGSDFVQLCVIFHLTNIRTYDIIVNSARHGRRRAAIEKIADMRVSVYARIGLGKCPEKPGSRDLLFLFFKILL